jgi:hypothetical protein
VPESDIRFTEQDVQEEVLIEKSKAYLKKIIGETLKIKPHRPQNSCCQDGWRAFAFDSGRCTFGMNRKIDTSGNSCPAITVFETFTCVVN